MSRWTIEDSAELYRIPHWGKEFLRINDKGHLVIAPDALGHGDAPAVDLKVLVDDIGKRGISLPLLLRFSDLLRARIETLAGAFNTAIAEYDYKGTFRGVFPVKVNQQRPVIEDVVRFSEPHHMGLEAGSKPELLVVLAMLNDPDAVIVCNGYKDEGYVRLALRGCQLGRKVFLIIEKPHETEMIARVAKQMGVRPLLGARTRLQARGSGMWERSTGAGAKFGLTTQELLGIKKNIHTHCPAVNDINIGRKFNAMLRYSRNMITMLNLYIATAISTGMARAMRNIGR